MKKLCKKKNSQQGNSVVATPIGNLKIYSSEYAISKIDFVGTKVKYKYNFNPKTLSSMLQSLQTMGDYQVGDGQALHLGEARGFIPHAESKQFNFRDPHDLLVVLFLIDLAEYLTNPTNKFSVPYELTGTPLQLKIWNRLAKIPSGSTETYSALAQELKTSPRVVGNACRKNPLPLLIPCHRVVAKSGVGGYCGKTAGNMLKIKSILLQNEERCR